MAFRFWRRIRIIPGVTLNLSKSGGSLSFGPRGAKYTISPRGTRNTIGLPGTGLFYTTTSSNKSSRRSKTSSHSAPSITEKNRLTLSFFKRLITPKHERELVDGCKELLSGHESSALSHLRNAAHLADGAFLAGFISLKKRRYDDAIVYLVSAKEKKRNLGRHFSKYGISMTVSLTITEEVTAQIEPDTRGILLALVEAYQHQKKWSDALAAIEKLLKLSPYDPVVKLSYAELLLEAKQAEKNTFKKIVKLAEGVENETAIHAALLLYKARALRGLGLLDAARDTISKTIRRKKGRSAELLNALRYERAVVYREMGQKKRARSEFEKLYAKDPDYEDVAARLGV